MTPKSSRRTGRQRSAVRARQRRWKAPHQRAARRTSRCGPSGIPSHPIAPRGGAAVGARGPAAAALRRGARRVVRAATAPAVCTSGPSCRASRQAPRAALHRAGRAFAAGMAGFERGSLNGPRPFNVAPRGSRVAVTRTPAAAVRESAQRRPESSLLGAAPGVCLCCLCVLSSSRLSPVSSSSAPPQARAVHAPTAAPACGCAGVRALGADRLVPLDGLFIRHSDFRPERLGAPPSRVSACACVRACVCVCVRACVRVCVCVCVCVPVSFDARVTWC